MTCYKSICWLALLAPLFPPSSLQSHCQLQDEPRPRLFVLSDIANEPDDAQSLVRLMAYANEFRIEGLVATTSIWLNDTTRPDLMHEIVDAYGESLPNPQQRATGWPEAANIKKLIASGLPVYGMEGVGEGKDSSGSTLLVEAVDRSDEPLWIPIWGGASVLAQALWHVNATRSASGIENFVSKLRAYSISDQDNSGTCGFVEIGHSSFISPEFTTLIAMLLQLGAACQAKHTTISLATPTTKLVSPEWVKRNIQTSGALGSKYPDVDFIMEGDSPSLLYMIELSWARISQSGAGARHSRRTLPRA
ncbi:hypothetical protein BDV19DRAFT_395070 [Aspergillus venezuelensis]